MHSACGDMSDTKAVEGTVLRVKIYEGNVSSEQREYGTV